MKLLSGVFLCMATVAMAGAALADAGWNGTWVGNWDTKNGTQIVFAGDTFITMYWNGDYLSDAAGALSQGGKEVTITWTGGQAVLTRDGDAAARIVIREKGKPDAAFALKKDE